VRHVCWLDDASVAACTGTSLTLWKLAPGSADVAAVLSASPAGEMCCVVASPSGRYLAAALDNGTVQVGQGGCGTLGSAPLPVGSRVSGSTLM
jgi:hypothetical protein